MILKSWHIKDFLKKGHWSLYRTSVNLSMINNRNYPRGSFSLKDEAGTLECLKYDLMQLRKGKICAITK